MPTAYRVELANSNRAGCQRAECKKEAIKIQKGELRQGTLIEIQEHQSWKYRHWGCVTPAVIQNMQELSGGDMDLVDGYDELPEESQHKVRTALEMGHVADEDWKDDPELNRPGAKRKRTPKKKAGVDEDQEAADAPQSPTAKPAAKKRGRPKKEVAEEDEAQAPVAKKARGRPKKAAKAEDDGDAAVEAHADPPAAKSKARGKKAKTAVTAEDNIVDEEPQAAAEKKPVTRRDKGVRKTAKKEPADEEEVTPDSEVEERKPKGKGGRKKTTDAEAKPKKASRKKSD
ncbi:hypothetical protein LTR66_011511 [Elasticomyces elasticus]|nr:hypothetical protein LTR66_011511 [Elasticomyces elasticus]